MEQSDAGHSENPQTCHRRSRKGAEEVPPEAEGALHQDGGALPRDQRRGPGQQKELLRCVR